MIKALIIDDSLFMRKLVSDLLNSDPEIRVIDTAKNGEEALNKLPLLKPDVITLDLVMPGLDGLTTLKHIMSQYPAPVVILSAHSRENADITLKCLNEGAVTFVLKPSGEISLDIDKIKNSLINSVKSAAKVNVDKFKSLAVTKRKITRKKQITAHQIIVMGASTGGPPTLKAILSSLPSKFEIPIIIIQHLPSMFFTESLAKYLNNYCELMVKIAEHHEIIAPETVYLVPSGYNLTIRRVQSDLKKQGSMDVVICLTEDKNEMITPSIDITMKSAAQIYHKNCLGIILTGMGQDGLEGMGAIKKSGGKTICQDESALIFGMPKAVIDQGYADEVMSVQEISRELGSK